MKIITKFDPPPIPIRNFDWSAITDNYDGPGSPIGQGATEAEAIADLQEKLECEHDEHDHGICLHCGADITDDLIGRAELLEDR